MTTLNADKPDFPCNFLKQSDLEATSLPDLKAKSFHFIEQLAFRTIPFGVSPYGINCATAIDVIHMFLLGIIDYLHQTFTDHLTSKQYNDLSKAVAFIATFSSRGMNDYPNLAHFRKGLDRKGIMTAKMKLSRCFLVYLALKSSYFRTRLLDCKGKIPSSIKRKINKRKKEAKLRQEQYHYDEDSSDIGDGDHYDDNSSDIVADDHDQDSYDLEVEDDSDVDDNSNDESIYEDMEDADVDKDNEDDCSDDHIVADDGDDIDDCVADDSSIASDGNTASITDLQDQPIDEMDDDDDSIENHEAMVFTDNVYDKWVQLYEGTLTFYKWLTSDRLSHKMFKHGKLSIAKHCTQRFMIQYADVAKRWDGMGLKLTKFHQLRHWYFYISMYGVPLNFDSSFCESHHIQLMKRTGRRTQKRQDTLAFQTSMRVYEKNLIDSVSQLYCGDTFRERSPSSPMRNDCPITEDNAPTTRNGLNSLTDNHVSRGARFSLKLDYMQADNAILANPPPNIFHVFDEKPSVKFKWKAKRDRTKQKFVRRIMDAISNKLSWFNNGNGMK